MGGVKKAAKISVGRIERRKDKMYQTLFDAGISAALLLNGWFALRVDNRLAKLEKRVGRRAGE
jgi:uncharacterized membrane protein YciS (DUF1049 family)